METALATHGPPCTTLKSLNSIVVWPKYMNSNVSSLSPSSDEDINKRVRAVI